MPHHIEWGRILLEGARRELAPWRGARIYEEVQKALRNSGVIPATSFKEYSPFPNRAVYRTFIAPTPSQFEPDALTDFMSRLAFDRVKPSFIQPVIQTQDGRIRVGEIVFDEEAKKPPTEILKPQWRDSDLSPVYASYSASISIPPTIISVYPTREAAHTVGEYLKTRKQNRFAPVNEILEQMRFYLTEEQMQLLKTGGNMG